MATEGRRRPLGELRRETAAAETGTDYEYGYAWATFDLAQERMFSRSVEVYKTRTQQPAATRVLSTYGAGVETNPPSPIPPVPRRRGMKRKEKKRGGGKEKKKQDRRFIQKKKAPKSRPEPESRRTGNSHFTYQVRT